MDKNEKLAAAEIAKKRGTEFFKQSKYRLALGKYQRVIDLLGGEDRLEGADKTQRDSLYVAAQLNCALCCLKGRDAPACIRHCNAVLETDANNVKALYRKAQALEEQREYDSAVMVFSLLKKLDPENKAAERGIRDCRSKLKEQAAKDRKIFANMFQKFAEQDFKASLKTNPSLDNSQSAEDTVADHSCGEKGNNQQASDMADS